jgi:hypothetical protein
MLACDFFHVDCAVTLQRISVFFVLEVPSRSVYLLGATTNPTADDHPADPQSGHGSRRPLSGHGSSSSKSLVSFAKAHVVRASISATLARRSLVIDGGFARCGDSNARSPFPVPFTAEGDIGIFVE